MSCELKCLIVVHHLCCKVNHAFRVDVGCMSTTIFFKVKDCRWHLTYTWKISFGKEPLDKFSQETCTRNYCGFASNHCVLGYTSTLKDYVFPNNFIVHMKLLTKLPSLRNLINRANPTKWRRAFILVDVKKYIVD